MVPKVGWDLWCVFLSKYGEKIFCEKEICFKSKNKCLVTNWHLFLWLRNNFSTLLRAPNKKDWFSYSSNLPRMFTMEYIFCLLIPLEHTLVYVFLFILKYIRIFYKIKDGGFCKKANLMLRRLFYSASFNEDNIACTFTES